MLCRNSDGTTFQIKRAQRYFSSECTGRAKDLVLLRDDCNGQSGRMERRKVEGVDTRGVSVDLHKTRIV